tara:strand:+ start:1336 stop:1821 length:486 start_codon:yes stop_codon:yes gene_type:complete
MRKVLGAFLILLSLPLLAWTIYVEIVFLGEAKGKYNKMMTTAEQRYSESKAEADKRYKTKKETTAKNYKEKLATLEGQSKIAFEKQFKELEKTFHETYQKAVKFREDTYQKVKTTMENAFDERVSKEREVSYSIPSGILGILFLVIGVFFIRSGRKKISTS